MTLLLEGKTDGRENLLPATLPFRKQFYLPCAWERGSIAPRTEVEAAFHMCT